MALLDDVKLTLRITNVALDVEVQDLIAAAKIDLKISGVVNEDELDPLIKRAIILYCKANFGYDNPDAIRFMESYVSLKIHLALCGDYNVGVEIV